MKSSAEGPQTFPTWAGAQRKGSISWWALPWQQLPSVPGNVLTAFCHIRGVSPKVGGPTCVPGDNRTEQPWIPYWGQLPPSGSSLMFPTTRREKPQSGPHLTKAPVQQLKISSSNKEREDASNSDLWDRHRFAFLISFFKSSSFTHDIGFQGTQLI